MGHRREAGVIRAFAGSRLLAGWFRPIDDFQLFNTGKRMIVVDEDRVQRESVSGAVSRHNPPNPEPPRARSITKAFGLRRFLRVLRGLCG